VAHSPLIAVLAALPAILGSVCWVVAAVAALIDQHHDCGDGSEHRQDRRQQVEHLNNSIERHNPGRLPPAR
jgi:hypothetical protein